MSIIHTLLAVILQNRIDYSIHFYEFVCSELISSFILLGKRIPSFFSSISSNSSIIDLKENNILEYQGSSKKGKWVIKK